LHPSDTFSKITGGDDEEEARTMLIKTESSLDIPEIEPETSPWVPLPLFTEQEIKNQFKEIMKKYKS
jgi:hypothetical protein